MNYFGYGLLAGACCAGLLLCTAGCGNDNQPAEPPHGISGFKNFVSPKEIPVWLAVRQWNGIERNYNLTVEEASDLVIIAIRSTGGTVRYGTMIGKARTIYGLTAEGESITVDIDPYRGQERKVELDICVGMYGNKAKEERIFQALAALPADS